MATAESTHHYGTTKYNLNGAGWTTTVPTATNVGEHHIYGRVFGDSNHEDSSDSSGILTITPRPITDSVISFSLNTTSYNYDGTPKEPGTTLKYGTYTLVEGTDYTVSYTNNINANTTNSTPTCTVTGIGNYSGTRSLTFTINKVDLTITAQNATRAYRTPNPQFTFTYSGQKNNENPAFSDTLHTIAQPYTTADVESVPGTYPIKLDKISLADSTGFLASNYNLVRVDATLTITSNTEWVAVLPSHVFEFNGQAQVYPSTNDVKVYDTNNSGTLMRKDTDYTLTYSNNINAGNTAKVTVTGKGSYAGKSIDLFFTIEPRPLYVTPNNKTKTYGDSDPALDWTYTNHVSTPAFSGALKRDAGEQLGAYPIRKNTLALKDGTNFLASNYYMVFDESKTLTIVAAAISDYSLTLNPKSFVYNGNYQEPSVTVKYRGNTLTKGAANDYTVTFKDNLNVGTATATVILRNNHTGTLTDTFTITKANIVGSVTIKCNTNDPSAGNILSAEVTVNPSDAKLEYQWYTSTSNATSGGTPITGATSYRYTLTDNEINKYVYVVVKAQKDNYNDNTFSNNIGVKIKEKQKPTTPVLTAKLNNSTGANYEGGKWTNQNVWLNVKSTDNYSLARYEYSTTSPTTGFTSMTTAADGSASITLNTNKNQVRYYFRAVDSYSNISEVVSIVVAIDKVAPTITEVSKDIVEWTNKPVTATGKATDDLSGISGYFFAANTSNEFTNISAGLAVTQSQKFESNVYSYYFGVRDQAGNTAFSPFSITNIDTIKPNLTIVANRTDPKITLEISVSDAQSGINEVTVNGQKVALTPSGAGYKGYFDIVEGGVYKIIVNDKAGNEETDTKTVYSVIYSGNGASGFMDRQLKYAGENIIIKSCEYQSEEYSFVRWNTAQNGSGTNYNPGATYSQNQSITLYAQWNKINFTLDRVVLDSYVYPYTGDAIVPNEKVYNNFGTLLEKDEDYKVAITNNINIGVATVTVTGINRYAGQTVTTTFQITGVNMEDVSVEINPNIFVYDGYAKEPKVTVKYGTDTLVNGKDYLVTYRNNINAGTATVVITGREHCFGEKTVNFVIEKADRNIKTYNMGLIVGERVSADFTYEGSRVTDTLVSNGTSIATVEKTNTQFFVNAVNQGFTTLRYFVPADNNYNSAEAIIQVTVFKDEESAKPLYGTVLINDGDAYTVTPRTVLTIRAERATYMYISTQNLKPSVDSPEWHDYSTKMPFVFDDAEGTKAIYVWFKDDNGNISDVAIDTIVLSYDYEYPANDSIILDKTPIDKEQPSVEYVSKLPMPSGVTMDVIFNQQDVLVNGIRSGVDNNTIKYGYKKKGSTGDYTWSNTNRFSGLEYAGNYVVVTQAYDRAGNGPTISDEYEFTTPAKYETTIVLHDTNVVCDGLVHEIDAAEFTQYGDNKPTGTITYTYYTDRECTRKTIPAVNGSVSEGSAPSRPGTYYVVCTLTDDPNYHDATSNMARLRIGWDITADDSDGHVFAYIEETGTDTGKYELTITGKGDTKDLDDLIAQDPDESLSYWSEYKDVIQILTFDNAPENNITGIGDELFSDLTSLEQIVLPDTLVTIGDGAFKGDTNVTNIITIPGTVKEIGDNPFADVSTPGFVVEYGNSNYDVIPFEGQDYGILVSKDHEDLVAYPAGNTQTDYTVPETIKNILPSAFEGADNLKDVILPDGIETIGPKAFYDCDNLEVIEIFELKDDNAKVLKEIGENAFIGISDHSSIYTFSKEVADMITKDRDYDPAKTTVYWPPIFTLQPMDMNGKVGQPVKFIVEAKDGYLEGITYEWMKVGGTEYDYVNDKNMGTLHEGSGYNTKEYTTKALQASDNGVQYYCVAYNMPYYHERGYSRSIKATVTMLASGNYRVERGTYNQYYFDTLQEAFDFAQDNDVIRILENVTGEHDAVLESGKNNIRITGEFNGESHTIGFEGTLKIEEGSSIIISGPGGISKNDAGYVIENNGAITIDNSAFTISNTAGNGIKLNDGSKLDIVAGTIRTTGTAINADSAEINMTSPNAKIEVNASTNVHAVDLTGDSKFNMENGEIKVTCSSTSATDVVGIYNAGKDDDNSRKGRVTISGGTINVSGNGTKAGDGIVNAGSSDLIMTGGKVTGSRSGIETTPSNYFGNVIIQSGEVEGGLIGIINNGGNTKVILGVNDGTVSTTNPSITGGKIAIINASRNDTLEFYDGVLKTSSDDDSIIIYENINNRNITIDDSITGMIYQENGRGDITTETGYSIKYEIVGGQKIAYLAESELPRPRNIPDITVEEGEEPIVEVIIDGPGHPDDYEFEWEISIDGGDTWNKVTTGVGINSPKYQLIPVSKEMDGNLYRCKITSRAGVTYTNVITLHVMDETLYKEQKPYVRVIYKNEAKHVNYESEDVKYVDVQVIIKSFAELETVEFTYGTVKEKQILGQGSQSTAGLYTLNEEPLIKVVRADDVFEYTYTYNVKAYKNGIITVHAVDTQKREHTDSMTIDAIYDLNIKHDISKLSDLNDRLVITFYANKKVRPIGSTTDSSSTSIYTELKSLDGSQYAYQFTLRPSSALPNTVFTFEDEYGNRADDFVNAIARIEYKDVKFNDEASSRSISDMTAIDAYNVAQNLESETEINTNSDVQSRYGISKVQADMFMARARDVGAVDMLSGADSSRSYDGAYVKEIEQSQDADSAYDYQGNSRDIYTSAVAGTDNKLSNEKSNYVDTITESNKDKYKGTNVSGISFGTETPPYVYIDSAGNTITVGEEIYDASFRAVIVGN